jgi:Na+-translocating ferredoxin:NAD+ oxidoreductase RnfG subunit
MATNTTVLIVVAAMSALLLAGMLAGVAYKTRTQQRHVKGETIRDQAEQNALQVRHQEALADESAVKAHAAQVEVDVKTARAWRV